MKKSKFPLHLQIMLALLLGAIFGAVFSIDQHKLIVQTKEKEVFVKDWTNIGFYASKPDYDSNNPLKEFTSSDQTAIIDFYQKNKEIKSLIIAGRLEGKEDFYYKDLLSLEKEETPATMIKPIGSLFIKLLSFLAIPLVLASLIVGASSLDNIKKLGRIGGKTFGIYLSTTALAITIGLVTANIIAPGDKVAPEAKERLMSSYQSSDASKMAKDMEIDLVDFFVKIVPKNPIKAMADGNMLQIVFFAVFFGIALSLINREKAQPLINVFEGISETMIKMVDIVMKIAPYGVFALIAATIADFGFEIISTLFWYMASVVLGLLIQMMLVYSLIVFFMGKMNPLKFFAGIKNALVIGFSTSSSAATLPITYDCVERNLKVPKQISGFVLPLGATINMDGTALYQGVAAVFIAQVYGIDLSLAAQLTIVLTAVLASIGTAPVPGVGIIMLVIILQSVNIPAEGIALILGVDRILDMCRTTTNISGDSAVALAVAGTEKK